MTETVLTPAAVPAPVVPAVPAPVAPVQAAPEGFVAQADLDRVEHQRKGFQSELARVTAELAAATAKPVTPAAPAATDGVASEIAALRAEITAAGKLAANQASVPTLKTEFKYADPNLFTAETVATYGSPDALRIAVEADHNRVSALVAAGVAEKEAELKGSLSGQSPLGPVAPPVPGVDPTPQQLNAMTTTELDAFAAANPGVIERVLLAATAG